MEYWIYSRKVRPFNIIYIISLLDILIKLNNCRLKVCATKLLNDIPQAKRDGYSVSSYLFTNW